MGRCACLCYCLHGHVADGKKESRKLALVDRDKYCIDTSLFCERLCIHKCILFSVAGNGLRGTGRMEEESVACSCSYAYINQLLLFMKKIVIIGPESTGKSTLAKQLAEHYNTLWVAEFARQYLLKNGTEYSYDDLLTIAKGQLALEAELSSEVKNMIFIDTDMYVMKVWCEFVFSRCHTWILDQVVKQKYDLYLLCYTDLPWVRDELREYPDLKNRHLLYHMYKDIMINQPVPWVDISGNYQQRLQKAIQGINEQLL